eukprot:CAMPEP_0170553102 /NCGR_PEP_ID=MMETSP0211-20121228/10944_1 /TAXON_ID=311385 /ORGANISM="Pseudokeronopsis sp., Strain OXSARD2" /LENGTH=139 /DNA_ID=CAMNT_0010861231 /DNA_START=1760 /DNA_END=2176 /DNA_ORIENTATION=-
MTLSRNGKLRIEGREDDRSSTKNLEGGAREDEAVAKEEATEMTIRGKKKITIGSIPRATLWKVRTWRIPMTRRKTMLPRSLILGRTLPTMRRRKKGGAREVGVEAEEVEEGAAKEPREEVSITKRTTTTRSMLQCSKPP